MPHGRRVPTPGPPPARTYCATEAGQTGTGHTRSMDPQTGDANLSGRVYLVAGGAGVAGASITAGIARRGGTVIVPSRSERRLTALRAELAPSLNPLIHMAEADVGVPEGAERLRDRVVSQHGRLDGVVASLGGWWEGAPLTEVSLPVWERILRENLTSHFVVARAFLPLLADRQDGVYVAMAGIAARQPEPRAAPVSVTGAAQTMMMRTLRAQYAGTPLRLHEVTVLTPIVTGRWESGRPRRPGWIGGAEVGDYVARVLSPSFEPADWLILSIP